MNAWRAAWTIARKDLRIYCRDKTGMLLGFGLPVVLVVAFGLVYKMTFGREGGLTRTTLWVADADGSEQSAAFVAGLRASDVLRVQPSAEEPAETRESLRKKVEDGEAHHALVIEPGFSAALAAGRLPRLSLFRDPGRELEGTMVSIGLMQGVLSARGADLAPAMTTRALTLLGLPEQWSDRIQALSNSFSQSVQVLFSEAGEAGLLRNDPESGGEEAAKDAAAGFQSVLADLVPVEKIDVQPPERPKQLSYMLAHNIAGISVMMLMFGLVACGVLLIQERDEGTLQRLLMSSLPRSALLNGKFLFTAVIGAAQLLVMYLVGGGVFRVNLLADPVTLLVISAALVFSVSAFGILIAALARTAKQAEGLSTLIILVMSALGGAWFPLYMFDLPLAGQIVSRCTLTWWAMSAYSGMLWYGRGWSDPAMLRDVGVLVAFGVVAMLVARTAFRKRYVTA